jgi:DNA-binding transcriptional LysR family regulator
VVELTGAAVEPVDGFLDDRGVFRRIWIERVLIEMGNQNEGLAGRVAVSVPYYAAVGPMLLVSDMVATLPRRLAEVVAKQQPLALLDLPYEPLTVPVEVVWHQRSDRDSGILWLISQLTQALKPND